MLIVPLKIMITPFSERGVDEPSTWTTTAATDALRVANTIWMVANVQFHLKEPVSVDTPLDLPKGSRKDENLVLNVLSDRRPAGTLANVFLINPVQGLVAGGASYHDGDPEAACFAQEYSDATSSGRALAHEFGHLLSLEDITIDFQNERQAAIQRKNLMYEALTTGTNLDPTQIKKVKSGRLARKFAG